MKLKKLEIRGCYKIEDFSALKEMPLSELNIQSTILDDLTLFEEMPLKTLNISDTRTDNLQPLTDLPLTTLICDNIRARNLNLSKVCNSKTCLALEPESTTSALSKACR